MKVACLWFEQAAPTLKLAELFLRFSPQIGLRGQEAIFVEIGKSHRLYSESTFLARAQALLRHVQYPARIGFGTGITDAVALTRWQARTVDELPLEALQDFVDPLSRDEFLRKSTLKMAESFRDLGVTTLAEFKALPIGELVARFGVLGRFAHQRVHLRDFVTWPQWTPEEIIEEKKEFPCFEFYGELEPILFELKNQLDQIFARLRARERRLIRLRVQIRCEKISTHPDFLRVLDFDFFAPQGSAKGALRIIKERLTREFERRPVRSPIEAISSQVLKHVAFQGGQRNILNNDEERREQAHSLHNQLLEILGKDQVYHVELVEDRRPERAWQQSKSPPHEAPENRLDVNDLLPRRATYLCRKPLPIQVTAGFLHIQKRRYRIRHWDNQIERINGAWFEAPETGLENAFDRSYFAVELEGGQRIWVFETPQREFFLHGYDG